MPEVTPPGVSGLTDIQPQRIAQQAPPPTNLQPMQRIQPQPPRQAQAQLIEHDIGAGREITYFTGTGQRGGVTASGGTFYSISGQSEDLLFRSPAEAQAYATSIGTPITSQVGVSDISSAEYWAAKTAKEEAAKAAYGGVRPAGALTPIGEAMPGTQLKMKQEFLQSKTAQWGSEAQFQEAVKAVGQYVPVSATARIVTPGFTSGQEQLNYLQAIANQNLAQSQAGFKPTTYPGISEYAGYKPIDINELRAAGVPIRSVESVKAEEWYKGLSFPAKAAVDFTTITQNLFSGFIDWAGVKSSGRPIAPQLEILAFNPSEAWQLESAKMGATTVTYKPIATPEQKGFGDFSLLAYRTMGIGTRKPGETTRQAAEAGFMVALPIIGKNEAQDLAAMILTFGAVGAVSPKVASTAGKLLVSGGLAYSGALAVTGQEREAAISAAPFALMIPGLVKTPKIDIPYEKMFGKARPAEAKAPEITVSSDFMTGSVYRPAVRETSIGKPSAVKYASYGRLEDIGFVTGDISRPAIRNTAITAAAIMGTQVIGASAKEQDIKMLRNEAYNIASELSIGKPEVTGIEPPRSPTKAETKLQKAQAAEMARNVAIEMGNRGYDVEARGTKVIMKGKPSEVVADIEYFNKQKIEQATQFSKGFGSESLKGLDILAPTGYGGRTIQAGDIGILGKMFGTNFIDTPLLGIDIPGLTVRPTSAEGYNLLYGGITEKPYVRRLSLYERMFGTKRTTEAYIKVQPTVAEYNLMVGERPEQYQDLFKKLFGKSRPTYIRKVSEIKKLPDIAEYNRMVRERQNTFLESSQTVNVLDYLLVMPSTKLVQRQRVFPSARIGQRAGIRLTARQRLRISQEEESFKMLGLSGVRVAELQRDIPSEAIRTASLEALSPGYRTADLTSSAYAVATGEATRTAEMMKTAEATGLQERTLQDQLREQLQRTAEGQRERQRTRPDIRYDRGMFKLPTPPTDRKKRKHIATQTKGGFFQTYRGTPLILPLQGVREMFKLPAKNSHKKSRKGRR